MPQHAFEAVLAATGGASRERRIVEYMWVACSVVRDVQWAAGAATESRVPLPCGACDAGAERVLAAAPAVESPVG